MTADDCYTSLSSNPISPVFSSIYGVSYFTVQLSGGSTGAVRYYRKSSIDRVPQARAYLFNGWLNAIDSFGVTLVATVISVLRVLAVSDQTLLSSEPSCALSCLSVGEGGGGGALQKGAFSNWRFLALVHI